MRNAPRSRISTRALALTAATGSASLLVGLSQALLAHILPIRQVGAFSFAISFVMLSALIFEFGLFLPLPRLIAREDGAAEKRELVGAAILVFLPVGALFCVWIAFASFGVDRVFHVHAGRILRTSAWLAWPYPFIAIALLLAQGTEEIMKYSAAGVVAPGAFVLTLGVLFAARVHLSAEVANIIRGGCYAIGALTLMQWLRPCFAHSRDHIRRLREESRRYGFKLYVGNVLALGTYQMDVLMLAAMTNARTVALYAVATSITQAIVLPGSGLSSTLVSRMARSGRLPPEWVRLLWAITGLAVIFTVLLARPFLSTVFSPAYAAASVYILPLGVAAGLRGVTSIYNAQLAATANGRALRTSAMILTLSNVILNLALIPPFKGVGAAIASAGAMLANLAAHIYFARRSEAELTRAESAGGAEPASGSAAESAHSDDRVGRPVEDLGSSP